MTYDDLVRILVSSDPEDWLRHDDQQAGIRLADLAQGPA